MGRTREFDIEKAIGIATNLFWAKGYAGTSLNDLTDAMGIGPPSFYFAFGSKEALFRTVIERYQDAVIAFEAEAFQEPTARAVATRLLVGYAGVLTDPSHAPGCLVINNSLPRCEDPSFRSWLADLRIEQRGRLRDRFASACESGDLPANADPDALARFVVAMGWGMAVEAQSGATQEDLLRMLSVAFEAFPKGQR